MIPLPNSFVWTKMGAESGEALNTIIRRKDYERQLGDGLFAWGIGNALGKAVGALAAETSSPMAVFSPMLSKPKFEDTNPSGVLLWTAYEVGDGIGHPLPQHIVVTSRAHKTDGAMPRHYALLCHSESSLLQEQDKFEAVTPAGLRNFTTGNPLGASQVTSVVRRAGCPPADARNYAVSFTAMLATPRYVRLLAPRTLSAKEVDLMTMAAKHGFDQWQTFVRLIRGTGDVPHLEHELIKN